MIGLTSAFALGFIAWFATGVDDFVLIALMLKRTASGNKRYVLIGNVLAIITLLVAAVIAATLLDKVEFSPWVMKIPGLIVIAFGVKELIEAFGGKIPIHIGKHIQEGGLAKGKKHNFFRGFVIYMIVSGLNDFVVAALIMWEEARMAAERFVFSGGFMIGALVSFAIAKAMSARIKNAKALDFVAAITLIVLGILLFMQVEFY